VERAHLLPLNRLQVLIRCANTSISYGLTNEHVRTLLGHTPQMVLHVFALQVKSSLQFHNQALPKSGALGIKLSKMMTKKLTQKSLHTAPLRGSIRHVMSKSVVDPASGRRGGAIAPSNLTRVVHIDEVT
jgi:hypothetical protein